MKLLDDLKIPIARQNPRRPHHSHKLLDVAVEMGLKPGRPYCMRHCHHGALPLRMTMGRIWAWYDRAIPYLYPYS
jgi:hypothetical protein